MAQVLVGLVGEAPVVEDYPLGPQLRRRLDGVDWTGIKVSIEAMNWGAMHVVQGLEERRGVFDRVVLAACVERGADPGAIRCGVWSHDRMAPLALQERMYEAVTGIVSVDNLLAIGEHFGVWPAEVLTVEVEVPRTLFGTMVMTVDQCRLDGTPMDWVRRIGFDPAAAIEALAQAVVLATTVGRSAALPWEARTIETMMPAERWHNVSPA